MSALGFTNIPSYLQQELICFRLFSPHPGFVYLRHKPEETKLLYYFSSFSTFFRDYTDTVVKGSQTMN